MDVALTLEVARRRMEVYKFLKLSDSFGAVQFLVGQICRSGYRWCLLAGDKAHCVRVKITLAYLRH